MQLSVSTTSFPVPASSARATTADCPTNRPDDDVASAESNGGKPAKFDDLLSADADKPKGKSPFPANARGSNGSKSTRESVVASADSSISPELAALLASIGQPAAPVDATPVAVPEFDGALPTATAAANGEAGETFTAEAFGSSNGRSFTASSPTTATSAAQIQATQSATVPAAVAMPDAADAISSAVANLPVTDPVKTSPDAARVAEVAASVETPDVLPQTNTVVSPVRPDRGSKPALSFKAAANSAATEAVPTDLEKVGKKDAFRNFLVTKEEMVTERDESLGIDGAKTPVTMSSAVFSHSHSAVAESSALVPAVATPAGTEPVAPSNHLADTKSVALGAVEAVLSAAERVSAERSAVTLQFSVGGNDLAVRVAFRGGEVQATFRTDSPELRAALTHEWAAAGSKMTDASVRMAPPVFTSSDAGSSTNFSGEGAPQHQQQRESSASSSGGGFSLNAFRSSSADASAASRTPVATPRAAVSTALHLHTFA